MADLAAVLIRLGEQRMIERSTIPGFDKTVKEFEAKISEKRGRDMTEEEIEKALENPFPGLGMSPMA